MDEANSARSDLPIVEIDWEGVEYNTYRILFKNMSYEEMEAVANQFLRLPFHEELTEKLNVTFETCEPAPHPSLDLLKTELRQKMS